MTADEDDGSKVSKWLKVLRNPTATLLIGMAIASGVWRFVLPAIFPVSPIGAVEAVDEHAGHNRTETPLACTTAMRDMAVNLAKVQAVMEEQGKRMDRLEVKIDRLNDRLDYRVIDRQPTLRNGR